MIASVLPWSIPNHGFRYEFQKLDCQTLRANSYPQKLRFSPPFPYHLTSSPRQNKSLSNTAKWTSACSAPCPEPITYHFNPWCIFSVLKIIIKCFFVERFLFIPLNWNSIFQTFMKSYKRVLKLVHRHSFPSKSSVLKYVPIDRTLVRTFHLLSRVTGRNNCFAQKLFLSTKTTIFTMITKRISRNLFELLYDGKTGNIHTLSLP